MMHRQGSLRAVGAVLASFVVGLVASSASAETAEDIAADAIAAIGQITTETTDAIDERLGRSLDLIAEADTNGASDAKINALGRKGERRVTKASSSGQKLATKVTRSARRTLWLIEADPALVDQVEAARADALDTIQAEAQDARTQIEQAVDAATGDGDDDPGDDPSDDG